MSIATGIGDSSYRLVNGVRRRITDEGDADGWAEAHRHGCGSWAYMFGLGRLVYAVDTDAGPEVYSVDCEGHVFVEYAPDELRNYGDMMRKHRYVAMFDRKQTEFLARAAQAREFLSAELEMCRRLSVGQTRPVRFFYVVGGNAGPWAVHEVDTATKQFINAPVPITADNMGVVWTHIGIAQDRAVHIASMRHEHVAEKRHVVRSV